MKVGTANYDGNSGSSKKRFKISDGDNVYRILPPLGSLADKGKWNQYWSVVWGYKNAKGQNVPFADCREVNFNTKMVEVESAAYLKAKKVSDAYFELLKQKKEGKAVSDEVIKKTEELKDRYNIENKYYVNAVNLAGEIGLLKLGSNAIKLLKLEIKNLIARGVDPLSLENGRFFNISRTGKGRNTVYQVSVHKEARDINGEVAEFAKVHSMDAGFISRLANEAFDLGTLYTRATAEQVEAIVGGADPDVVLGRNQSNSGQSNGNGGNVSNSQSEKASESVKEELSTASLDSEDLDLDEDVSSNTNSSAPVGNLNVNVSDEDFLKSIGAI